MKLKKIIPLILCLFSIVLGTLLFSSASEGNVKPSLKIKACNVSFEESVHILYAVQYDGVDPSDVKMLYWTSPRAKKGDYVKENADMVSDNGKKTTVNGVDNCVVFENTQLWARNMTDVLYARAYVKINGVEYYSEVKSYSILEYVYNKLGHTGTATESESLKDLLTELLEYGTKTQHYFDYNTGKLPTDPHGKVNVHGGHLSDGMEHGFYKTETKITLTATTTPEKPYVKWLDGDGNVIGYGETIEITVKDTNASFTAECYALYSVKFVDSDGTVICVEDGLLLGDEITPPALGERAGYTLLGWATSPSGDTVYAPDDTIIMGDDDTDAYYAVWLPDDIEGTAGLTYGYTDYNETSYSVTGYTGAEDSIVIGNSYNGLPVTGIAASAFSGNTTLRNVIICDGISVIGSRAFNGCTSLESITLAPSITTMAQSAFENCSALSSVSLDSRLETIGSFAFRGCSSLSSIEINNASLSYVGSDAFSGCTKLCDVYVTDLSQWCATTFENRYSAITGNQARLYINGELVTDLVIPDGVERVSAYAFAGCLGIETITLPKTLTYIGTQAFGFNTVVLKNVYVDSIETWLGIEFAEVANPLSSSVDLFIKNGEGTAPVTEVVIPEGVTSIKPYAFYCYDNLTAVTISGSVTEIGEAAFAGSSLTSVTIGSGVVSIGRVAFDNCRALSEITLSASVETIDEYAFNGCSALKTVNVLDIGAWCKLKFANSTSNPLCNGGKLFLNGEEISELIIPDGVTEIGTGAFKNITTLTSVRIPASVTTIGEFAFSGCASLEALHFTEGGMLAEIGRFAFQSCAISELSIPSGVTAIGEGAFYDCNKLSEVTVPDTVTSLGTQIFSGCTSLTAATVCGNITEHMFAGCTSLTTVNMIGTKSIGGYAFLNCVGLNSIVIPTSVTEILAYALYNANISEIKYAGTESDWSMIAVGSNNTALETATIIYGYAEIEQP